MLVSSAAPSDAVAAANAAAAHSVRSKLVSSRYCVSSGRRSTSVAVAWARSWAWAQEHSEKERGASSETCASCARAYVGQGARAGMQGWCGTGRPVCMHGPVVGLDSHGRDQSLREYGQTPVRQHGSSEHGSEPCAVALRFRRRRRRGAAHRIQDPTSGPSAARAWSGQRGQHLLPLGRRHAQLAATSTGHAAPCHQRSRKAVRVCTGFRVGASLCKNRASAIVVRMQHTTVVRLHGGSPQTLSAASSARL